jgi:hypothetical protein
LYNFSAQNLLINSHQAHQMLLILFIISQWVYQMTIQAHLGIIMALDVMLGWRDLQAVGKFWHFLSNFSAQNLLINSHQAHQMDRNLYQAPRVPIFWREAFKKRVSHIITFTEFR